MKEQINQAIDWIKNQDIDGCLTGSCLLDYFEGQDIDIFVFNEAAFTKLIYSMYFDRDKKFLLVEELEQWKFKDWTSNPYKGSLKKLGLISIKFKYNMCVDVNVIFKEKHNSVFDVLSSFDMDIICKGIDLKTKKELDLSDNVGTKVATWNKWNKAFYDPNIWQISRILRQFERVVKYHNRGYNTDLIVLKYKQIITDLINYKNIFKSISVNEKVESIKINGTILLQIFDKWLETHTIKDEELELLRETIKKI